MQETGNNNYQITINQTSEGSDTGEASSVPLLAAPARVALLPRIAVGSIFLMVSVVSGAGLLAAVVPDQVVARFVDSSNQVAAAPQVFDTREFDALNLTAKSVYIVDASDDEMLFMRAPDIQLPLASLTKVMLTLAISEVLDMNDTVTISRGAVERGGGGLTYGEVWRVRDLIDFMLIVSSNTAAEALAEAANEALHEKYPETPAHGATVARMNSLAKELGLTETYFLNPSGLDESETQAGAFGSARDIAKLFLHAIRNERELFAGTARAQATLGPLNYPKRDVENTNDTLETIPNIYMGKTGFTDLAGGNLAIAFDASENHPVVVVVLGSTQEGRFEDMRSLVSATLKTLLAPRGFTAPIQ